MLSARALSISVCPYSVCFYVLISVCLLTQVLSAWPSSIQRYNTDVVHKQEAAHSGAVQLLPGGQRGGPLRMYAES